MMSPDGMEREMLVVNRQYSNGIAGPTVVSDRQVRHSSPITDWLHSPTSQSDCSFVELPGLPSSVDTGLVSGKEYI